MMMIYTYIYDPKRQNVIKKEQPSVSLRSSSSTWHSRQAVQCHIHVYVYEDVDYVKDWQRSGARHTVK